MPSAGVGDRDCGGYGYRRSLIVMVVGVGCSSDHSVSRVMVSSGKDRNREGGSGG